jgi:thiosulfate/3-mercaptopyruvate sulfurtransferase
LPNKKRDGKDDFRKARIPGAQYFDIDAIADKSSALKHMLPPAHAFSAAMDKLSIRNADTVVIYETNGMAFAAARAWWMFKCFGHADVKVLNGGLPAWKEAGESLLKLDDAAVSEESIQAAGNASIAAQEGNAASSGSPQYEAALREQLVVSKEDILEDLSRGKEERKMFLLDARGEARFKGTEPEARPGLRSGHIPGSFNMSFSSLLEKGTTMKSRGLFVYNI